MTSAPKQHTRVAAYGLVVKAAQILLCRISKELPEHAGHWTLPGGGLDFGESPKNAMVREVFEETGLSVRPASIAGIDSIVIDTETTIQHGIRIMYHVSDIEGDLVFEKAGSTDMCQWFPLAQTSTLPLVALAATGIRIAASQTRTDAQ